MNILAIDCSTEFEIAAVTTGMGSADMTRRVDRSHSVTLFESIQKALEQTGISIHDIDLIGCGVGPGSFTGLRIAVTTARMLAQILKVPAVPLASPMIWAASVTAPAGTALIAAFDAKKGRVFGGVYRAVSDPGMPETILEPGDFHIQELINAAGGSASIYALGSGCERYGDELEKNIPDPVIIRGFTPSGIKACALAAQGDGTADYNLLYPDYARKSDAEAAFDKRVLNL